MSSFDAEVAQFLRVLFEMADIRHGITASYSAVYAIMKVCVLSSMDQRRR
jgi:hypothetical protein